MWASRGRVEAWNDAAEHVDDKWERAFAKAERVRQGFAQTARGSDAGCIALGQNTHELVTPFPLRPCRWPSVH